jgi:hypothetical protein
MLGVTTICGGTADAAGSPGTAGDAAVGAVLDAAARVDNAVAGLKVLVQPLCVFRSLNADVVDNTNTIIPHNIIIFHEHNSSRA